MSKGVIYLGGGRTASRRALFGPKPIMSRVYNQTLVKWLRVEGGEGGTLAMAWTGNRDEATLIESYAAETAALAVKLIADARGLGWDAVYAEPVAGG